MEWTKNKSNNRNETNPICDRVFRIFCGDSGQNKINEETKKMFEIKSYE